MQHSCQLHSHVYNNINVAIVSSYDGCKWKIIPCRCPVAGNEDTSRAIFNMIQRTLGLSRYQLGGIWNLISLRHSIEYWLSLLNIHTSLLFHNLQTSYTLISKANREGNLFCSSAEIKITHSHTRKMIHETTEKVSHFYLSHKGLILKSYG